MGGRAGALQAPLQLLGAEFAQQGRQRHGGHLAHAALVVARCKGHQPLPAGGQVVGAGAAGGEGLDIFGNIFVLGTQMALLVWQQAIGAGAA